MSSTTDEFRTVSKYPRYKVSTTGIVIDTKTNQPVKHLITSRGDVYVKIRTPITENLSSKQVARLVLETFHPVLFSQNLVIGYRDGNKLNCSLSNIFWSKNNKKSYQFSFGDKTYLDYPVLVKDVNTGNITRYPDAATCCKAVGIDLSQYKERIRLGASHTFPEGKRYRIDTRK